MTYVPKTTTSKADEKLILKTVRLAMLLAGAAAGYNADPCGNGSHQRKVVDIDAAKALLAEVTKNGAKSMDGVLAKALLMPYLQQYEPDEFDFGGDLVVPFVMGFAADCARVLKQEREASQLKAAIAFAQVVVAQIDSRPTTTVDRLLPVYGGEITYRCAALDELMKAAIAEGRFVIVTDELASALRTLASVEIGGKAVQS